MAGCGTGPGAYMKGSNAEGDLAVLADGYLLLSGL